MYIKLFVLVMSLTLAGFSESASFNVNTTIDSVDINPGDGICEATTATGDCSLRAAIIETNALAGTDSINIPAGTYQLTIVGDDDSALLGDLDITIENVTITGAGMNQTIIDGNSIDRIFQISSTVVTLQDLTLQNGGDASATVVGGAVLFVGNATSRLNLINVNIKNNRANAGGGLFISGSPSNLPTASIVSTTFSTNTALFLGVTNPFGPAIYCKFCNLLIDASSISNNGEPSNALRVENGNLKMLNSTVSNNAGGGIRSTNSNMLIRFSTLVESNRPNLSFFSFDDSHSFEVGYSVLQSLTNNNCQSGDLPASIGYNVTSDNSCGFAEPTDLASTDALLETLGDNGGPTATHNPMSISPLVDQVPAANCTDNLAVALSVDQRGFTRPINTLCDIGAVELSSLLIFADGFE